MSTTNHTKKLLVKTFKIFHHPDLKTNHLRMKAIILNHCFLIDPLIMNSKLILTANTTLKTIILNRKGLKHSLFFFLIPHFY